MFYWKHSVQLILMTILTAGIQCLRDATTKAAVEVATEKKEKDLTGLRVGGTGIYFLPTFIPDIHYCF